MSSFPEANGMPTAGLQGSGRQRALTSEDLNILQQAASLLHVRSTILICWASRYTDQHHEQPLDSPSKNLQSSQPLAAGIAPSSSNGGMRRGSQGGRSVTTPFQQANLPNDGSLNFGDDEAIQCPTLSTASQTSDYDDFPYSRLLAINTPAADNHMVSYGQMLFDSRAEDAEDRLTKIFPTLEPSIMELPSGQAMTPHQWQIPESNKFLQDWLSGRFLINSEIGFERYSPPNYAPSTGATMDYTDQSQKNIGAVEDSQPYEDLWAREGLAYAQDQTSGEHPQHDLARSIEFGQDCMCDAPSGPTFTLTVANALGGSHRGPSSTDERLSRGSSAALRMPCPQPTSTSRTTRQANQRHKTDGVRKRHGPLNSDTRQQAAWNRKIGPCNRCKIQGNGCVPDPMDPIGICQPCRKLKYSHIELPCLRDNIINSILFRTSSTLPGLKRVIEVGVHDVISKAIREWDSHSRLIYLSHHIGLCFPVHVSQFSKDALNHDQIPENERFLYYHPYGLRNYEEVQKSFVENLLPKIPLYVRTIIGEEQHLSRSVFEAAMELRDLPHPPKLLMEILFIWTATRCIEGGWRIDGPETLGLARGADGNVDIPPLIDSQLYFVILKVLKPLRKKVMQGLYELFKAKKRSDWGLIFLCSYILLHNYEMIVKAQIEIARWWKAEVRFTNMAFISGCHRGANAILWHYYYFCKAQKPFDLDWSSEGSQDLEVLGKAEKARMAPIVGIVSLHRAALALASEGRDYEREFWFTGQLFDRKWQARVPLEDSPPA